MEKLFNNLSANALNPKWKEMINRTDALYLQSSDIRSPFERDYTRIINCDAFKRLKHKTQVFYSPKSEHICTRAEHVALVEAISYTIANHLGLNLELTKAIATAHDLGHPPFGHCGERILSKLAKHDISENFWHEKNGLYFVDNIELLENPNDYMENLNLTYAVRDGIISHCGEIDENGLKPRSEFIDLDTYSYPNQFTPFTWEACVVKIADKISYVGRDIQDAIKLGLLNNDSEELNSILSIDKTINNRNIVHYLTEDICSNSSIQNGLTFSDKAFKLLNSIKKFNYNHIYLAPKTCHSNKFFELVITQIYEILKECYVNDKNLMKNNILNLNRLYPLLSTSFYNFICKYSDFEDRNTLKLNNRLLLDISCKETYYSIIISFIAGMTDNFASEIYYSIINFNLS